MELSRDLSMHHGLVSDLFKWPGTREEWEQYKLTKEQVDFFKENGYLANVKLLEESQVDQLREELEQISDPNHPKHDLFYGFESNESKD
ncbi:MAG: phytanoyl-CoA dioxygenase family protein, partial [Bacteroidota bacterium]